jgi:O-antigen/teichoic acid export membrane protein
VFRPIAELASAGAVGQLIVLLSAPIVTRLYDPEAFATYTLIASISAFFAAVMTGRLETAVPLPATDKTSGAVAITAISIATVFGLIVMVVIMVFPASIAQFLGDASLESDLWLIPLVAYLSAVVQVLIYMQIRKRSYRTLSHNTVLQAVTSSGTQITVPLLGISYSGLLLSLVLSPLVATAFLVRPAKTAFSGTSVAQMSSALRKYKQYPIYGTPVALVNSAVSPIIVWYIFKTFGAEVAGLYALALRVLAAPISVIKESVRKVFWGEILTVLRERPNDAIPLFYSIMWKLLALGVPIIALAFLYGEPVVAYVFGEQWRNAGYIVAVLSPMLAISLATTSLANFSMIGRPKLGLLWATLQLSSIAILIYLSDYSDMRFRIFIAMYSATMIATYVIQVAIWHAAIQAIVKSHKPTDIP